MSYFKPQMLLENFQGWPLKLIRGKKKSKKKVYYKKEKPKWNLDTKIQAFKQEKSYQFSHMCFTFAHWHLYRCYTEYLTTYPMPKPK